MQPDTSPIPHTLAQWFGLALATLLAALGGWLARRKREPVELDKIKAETRQIHISSEVAQANVSLDILRELREITQKAEERREEWLQQKEQLRNQVVFWRNKAEELDGQLADTQETLWKLESEEKLHESQVKKLKAVLDYHRISYAELDQSKL